MKVWMFEKLKSLNPVWRNLNLKVWKQQMLKQVTKILLGILFVFGLVGCSKNVDKPNDENEQAI